MIIILYDRGILLVWIEEKKKGHVWCIMYGMEVWIKYRMIVYIEGRGANIYGTKLQRVGRYRNRARFKCGADNRVSDFREGHCQPRFSGPLTSHDVKAQSLSILSHTRMHFNTHNANNNSTIIIHIYFTYPLPLFYSHIPIHNLQFANMLLV